MTPTTIAHPRAFTEEGSRLMPIDLIHNRALDRLYERREAVQNLIRALEDYQQFRQTRMARSVETPRAGVQTEAVRSTGAASRCPPAH